MALSRRPLAYSKMDKEDPEERIHRRARFLIYKVLEQADSRRKPSCLRIRISKLKVKIGNRLRRIRKKIMSWKRLFGGGRQAIISLPPLFK